MTAETATLLSLALLFNAAALMALVRAWPEWIEVLLFSVGMLFLFRANPPQALADPCWTLAQSENLLVHGSFDLNDSFHLSPEDVAAHRMGPGIFPYQLSVVNGRILYSYPPGTSLLCLPAVAVARFLGVQICRSDGTYNYPAEFRLQRLIAATLMAATALALRHIARTRLSRGWSLGIALAASLSSTMWSVLATAVWSDTWGLLLMALTVLALARSETSGRAGSPVVLGSLLAWAVMVKPTYAVHSALVTLYLLTRRSRRWSLVLLLTEAMWAAGFVAWSEAVWEHWLPDYYRLGLMCAWSRVPRNLVYLLVTPSRGLFVFMPILLWALPLAVRHRRALALRGLARLAWANVAAMLLLIASWQFWEGGWTFGPRLLSSLIPWFVLLATLGLEARLRAGRAFTLWAWRPGALGVWVLLALGVFIHARGAHSAAVSCWNVRLGIGAEADAALRDWRQTMWLAGLVPEPPPADPPILLPGQRLDLGDPDSRWHLGEGWGASETTFRWTLGRRVVLAFRSVLTGEPAAASPEAVIGQLLGETSADDTLDANRDGHVDSADLVATVNGVPVTVSELVAFGAPATFPGFIDQQRVIVELNGETVGGTALTAALPAEIRIPLRPSRLRPGVNALVLRFPDARPSREFLRDSDDCRALGLQLSWIALR